MPSITPRTGPLGYANAAHLLRRATFGAASARIKSFANKTANEAVAELFQFNESLFPAPRYNDSLYIPTVADPSPVFDPLVHTGNAWLKNWWLHCAMIDQTLQHKLAFFLHSIFITNDEIAIFTLYDHHMLLRWHAKGSLKELAVRITRNLRMLYYLDNRLNTLTSPNENYGREFLELFTITKGPQIGPGNYTNYTEQDVQQAAKVLTGFDGNQGTATSRLTNYDPVTLIPQGTTTISKHDKTNKTFSAAFGNRVITGRTTAAGMPDELQEFVTMVFDQPATARSYARRIYRYFVNRNITEAIETDIITPLANTLLQNNYSLEAAVTQLLTSVHFYDEDDGVKGDTIWGAKVKDPLDFSLGIFRQLSIAIPDYVTQNLANYQFYNSRIFGRLTRLDLPFWKPFDVSGYPPHSKDPQYDRMWITPISLSARYTDFIDALITGYTHNGVRVQFDTVLFVRNSGVFSDPADATTLLNECFDLLFVSRPVGGRLTYFTNGLLGGLTPTNWRNDWNNYLNTNNKTTVKVALDRLFKTLIKSPEFQAI